jgi:RimJ/RimL family protein N-acetyltransferase
VVPHLVVAEIVGSPPNDADLDDLADLLANPRVSRSLGGPRARDVVAALLERWTALWETWGFGPWILRRADGAFVGYCGVGPASAAPGEIELLYACRPELWGQGVTGRAAREATDWAFREHGLVQLVAYTMTTNTASQRVLEKTGFVYERDFEHAGSAHRFYRLTRELWASHNQAG